MLDAVDIVTAVEAHAPLTRLAAQHGLPVICQKPLAATLAEAESMAAACEQAGVPLLVHENWRWQRPIRALNARLLSGRIGRPFRAHLQYSNSFPVFETQPFLKTLAHFILSDMGSHILDVARFLFGEAESLYCQTDRVHAAIQGEDVATVMMRMGDAGTTVTCELSYASRWERERFPELFMLIEGERGSLELAPDYWVRETTTEGTWSQRYPPIRYPWASVEHTLVHASIVDCQRNLLSALRNEGTAETTGRDNLETVRLVHAAYASTDRGMALDPREPF